MSFSDRDISDYYNQTQVHYEKWWDLKSHLSIHYGIWFSATRDLETALQNTNREMAKNAKVQRDDNILDAGCGVGGAAVFLAKEFNCRVQGITLNERQVQIAQETSKDLKLDSLLSFSLQSFSNTSFKDNSFDLIWACESTCYAYPKEDFLKEAYRVLKPGGRVIICDYFLTSKGLQDENRFIEKWGKLWAIDQFYTWADLSVALQKTNFKLASRNEYSNEVFLSSKRMYRRGWLGAIPSELYNLFHRTSRFAKKHYLSGIVQYKALKNKEWEYWMVVLQKPD